MMDRSESHQKPTRSIHVTEALHWDRVGKEMNRSRQEGRREQGVSIARAG